MSRFDSTCWTVVLGAAAGNREEQEVFSRQYAPVIRSYLAARWHRSTADDEVADGTQEVLLQLFRDHGALQKVERDRPGGFRAYLYGVIRNVALNLERKAATRKNAAQSMVLEAEDVAAQEATLSQVFDQAWMLMLVNEARRLLETRSSPGSAAERRLLCLRLRYEEELQPQAIAERLELKVQAVYDLLKQARADFKGALLEVLASHNPGASQAELESKCIELAAFL